MEFSGRIFAESIFIVIDLLLSEISRRFDQKTLNVIKDIKKGLIGAFNGCVIIPINTKQLYSDDIISSFRCSIENVTQFIESSQTQAIGD